MTDDTLTDQIAHLAELAWPIYRDSDWHWRGEPVTLTRLTAQLTDMVTSAATGAGYSTGGLSVYFDDEGNLELSVDVGFIDADSVDAWRSGRATTADPKDATDA